MPFFYFFSAAVIMIKSYKTHFQFHRFVVQTFLHIFCIMVSYWNIRWIVNKIRYCSTFFNITSYCMVKLLALHWKLVSHFVDTSFLIELRWIWNNICTQIKLLRLMTIMNENTGNSILSHSNNRKYYQII